jgi:amino acid adenylation domain-containing protein
MQDSSLITAGLGATPCAPAATSRDAMGSLACGPALPPAATHDLIEAFDAVVAAHGARIAVIDGDRQLDYRALDHASDALADALHARGARPGARIGLLMDRSADTVIATLAILKCGATCVPFDPAAPASRHAAQARAAGLHALIAGEGAGRPAGFEGVVLDPSARAATPPASRRHARCGDDAVAYVVHTSGSTGEPKGACLTHRGLLDLIRGADYAPVAPGDVVHHGMSIAFDGAIFEIWLALLNGGALSVLPPGASIATLCDLAERHRIAVMLLTTGLFNTLTDEALRRLTGLRTMLVGGDVLAPAVAARFLDFGGRMLVNAYGPTEITVFSHALVLRAGEPVPHPVPVGRPLANMRAYVLDEMMQPVPIGCEGEVYLGGSGVAAGYLDRPQLTDERFLPDPFVGGAARMYRSGDLARQRADGTLDFIGRSDGQLKINGFRVEPGEIEHVLCALDGLNAACVVAPRSANDRPQLHAFAVRGERSRLAPDALLAGLRERLPAYMVPRSLQLLDALPLTLNGKVDRRALLALCAPTADADDDKDAPPARGMPENADARAWLALLAECLGLPRVGADDNFFAIGGDSLSAMRFCALLEQTRGIDLPMTALFETDTLGELADRIATAAPSL